MATRLPLHPAHAQLGARLGAADGYLVPLAYGDAVREHAAVRERCGLIDRSERGKIEATGRDRVAFLQAMLSNDVKALQPGQGCEAALLDIHGKIVALLMVHALPDRLVLELERRLVGPTLEALDRYLISEKVELEDASDRAGLLSVAGPAARKVLEEVLGRTLPDLPVRHHVQATGAGEPARVVRDEETGEEGYDLWADPGDLPRLWERLRAGGAEPVGREAWNILRVEAGVVWHGVDVDASTLLLEASLPGAYSLDKGCYLGQEVVARITYRGHVNRQVVGFRFPDRRVPERGARVVVEGRDVGWITSAVVSPVLGRGLALGHLRREHWEPGSRVEVPGPDGSLTAEVSTLPFYRRSPVGG
jgi:glycine cleavage system T protein (aminomethyltransferase)